MITNADLTLGMADLIDKHHNGLISEGALASGLQSLIDDWNQQLSIGGLAKRVTEMNARYDAKWGAYLNLTVKGVLDLVADLPPTGNSEGDLYWVVEPGVDLPYGQSYVWIGSVWTAQGATLTMGQTGEGVPVGGPRDYVLTKASASDYDTYWGPPSASFWATPAGLDPSRSFFMFLGDSNAFLLTQSGGFNDRMDQMVAPGGKLAGLAGWANFGASGYQLTNFVNDGPTVGYVGPSSGNASWSFSGDKTGAYTNSLTSLDDAINWMDGTLDPDIRPYIFVTLGINDVALSASRGNQTEDQIVIYYVNLYQEMVERLHAARPNALIGLIIPQLLLPRPVSANIPKQTGPDSFSGWGVSQATDAALTAKWDRARYKATHIIAQQYGYTTIWDWRDTAGLPDGATVSAANHPFYTSSDGFHPNADATGHLALDLPSVLVDAWRPGPRWGRGLIADSVATLNNVDPITDYARYCELHPDRYALALEGDIGDVGSNYMDVRISLGKWAKAIRGVKPVWIQIGDSAGQRFDSLNPIVSGGGTRILSIAPSAAMQATTPGQRVKIYVDRSISSNDAYVDALAFDYVTNHESWIGTIAAAGNGYIDFGLDPVPGMFNISTLMGDGALAGLKLAVGGVDTTLDLSPTWTAALPFDNLNQIRILKAGDYTAYAGQRCALLVPAGVVSPKTREAANIDTDITLGGGSASDVVVPSQKAVKEFVNNKFGEIDVFRFKGGLDASTNPNYPAAEAGDVYKITADGTIGGVSGVVVENGDIITCISDSASAGGNQAAVGAYWNVQNRNITTSNDDTMVAESSQLVPTQYAAKRYTDAMGALKASLAGAVMTGVFAVAAGTVALPGLAIAGDLDTGLYAPAANTLGLTAGGTEFLRGTAGLTTVNGALAVSGQSLTGTQATSVVNLTSTWNTTGTPTGIKLNVTNTASNAASLLVDFQTGGVSRFSLRASDGRATFGESVSVGTHVNILNDGGLLRLGASSNVVLAWHASDVLAMRRSTSAQAFRVYNTYTDASNGEWGMFDWSNVANTLSIGTNKNGTGATRSVNFYVGGGLKSQFSAADNTTYINLLFGNHNTNNIGVSVSSSAPANIYAGTTIQAPTVVATSYNFSFGGRGYFSASADGVFGLYNAAFTDFTRLNFGGTSNLFPALRRSGAALLVYLADGSGYAALEAASLYTSGAIAAASSVGAGATNAHHWSGRTILRAPADGSFRILNQAETMGSTLVVEAASTLALRDATTAQELRLYSTYTDASNYERLGFSYSAGSFYIQSAYAGTGSARTIILQSASNLYLGSGGVVRWKVDTSSGHLNPNVTNTYDVGTTTYQVRSGYFGTNVVIGFSTTSTAQLHVGAGADLDIYNGALGSLSPQIINSQISGAAAIGAAVYDGTYNRRVGLFVDNTNSIWGLSLKYSSTTVPFVIIQSAAEQFRISTAGVVTVYNNLLNGIDNTNDLGTAGGGRFRHIYAGTGVTAGTYLRVNGTNAGYIALGAADDVVLSRDAANVLALRNGVNAQGFRVYNTYTDASNYERAVTAWATNVLEIGTEHAGTGTSRNLRLKVSGVADILFAVQNTNVWKFNSGGTLIPIATNTYDLGAGSFRVRTGYFGTSVDVSSGTITASAPALNITQTWNNAAANFTGALINITPTAVLSTSTSSALDVQSSGASLFRVSISGVTFSTAGFRGNGGTDLLTTNTGVFIPNSAVFGWSSTANAYNTADTLLYRDGAAGTLALRNSTNAQAFRIYNTWTDASNYERLNVAFSGNVAYLITQQAGTGSARNMVIGTQGAATVEVLTNNVSRWTWTSGGNYVPTTDATLSIGGASNQVLDIFASRALLIGGAAPAGAAGRSALQSFGRSYSLIGGDVLTDATDKTTRIGLLHYLAAEEPAGLLMGLTDATTNRVFIGGGSSSVNAATEVGIYTGANNTTPTGTKRWYWNSSGDYLALANNSYNVGVSISSGSPANIYAATALYAGVGIRLQSDTGYLSFGAAHDVALQRDGAAHTLALRASTNAQTFRVYNTWTDASNYERGYTAWSSNVFQIGTSAAGTGTARDVVIQPGGATLMTLSVGAPAAGMVQITRNTTSGNSPYLGIGGSWTGSSGVQSAIGILNTVNQSGTAGYTALLVNVTETATGSGVKLLQDWQVGGVSKASLTNGGVLTTLGLSVSADSLRITTAKTPASASATGTTGDVCWDSSYVYVCVATDTWKRAAIATW